MKKLLCLLLGIMLIATACTAQISEESDAGDKNQIALSPELPEQPDEINDDTDESEPDETAGFISERIVLGEGTEWAVEGMLTLPEDIQESLPAVVLVQGSGAHDMDETIFENKPFRDIAEYLSSNGIAVLRYDMRRFTHMEKMREQLGGGMTVREERIEDAILAAELLRADSRIDSDRIFILGHSQGGMLAPRIHAEGGHFAGLIIFAGSPRFLLDLSKDQNIAYIEEMFEGVERAVHMAQMDTWDEQIAELMGLSDEEAKETILDAGLHAYYFKDLYVNPIEDYFTDITVPIIVMHPANDVQVCAEKDFGLYKEILTGRDNVTFKLYEGLNHLFMPGEKVAIMEILGQYATPGKVDAQVLADIAQWIHAN